MKMQNKSQNRISIYSSKVSGQSVGAGIESHGTGIESHGTGVSQSGTRIGKFGFSFNQGLLLLLLTLGFAGSALAENNEGNVGMDWMISVTGNRVLATGHILGVRGDLKFVHGVGTVDKSGITELSLLSYVASMTLDRRSDKTQGQGTGKTQGQGTGKTQGQGTGKTQGQGTGKTQGQGTGKAESQGSAILIFSCQGVEGVAKIGEMEYIIKSPSSKTVFCSKG